ncbi:MAG: hypothetical protein FJ387_07675 [Verrucomicrobia bacterium]|nr:hypothetical protein [Verrucomicrobiota bacterium]
MTSATLSEIRPAPDDESLLAGLAAWPAQKIEEGLSLSHRFRRWHRQHVVAAEPTPETLEQDRRALETLLRFLGLFLAVAYDPRAFPPALRRQVQIEVQLLQAEWDSFHAPDRMTVPEAGVLLKGVFPAEALVDELFPR